MTHPAAKPKKKHAAKPAHHGKPARPGTPKTGTKSKHRKGTTGPTDEQMRALPSAPSASAKPKPVKNGWAKPAGKKNRWTKGAKVDAKRKKSPARSGGVEGAAGKKSPAAGKKFGERPAKKFGERPEKKFGERPEAPSFGGRPSRPEPRTKKFGKNQTNALRKHRGKMQRPTGEAAKAPRSERPDTRPAHKKDSAPRGNDTLPERGNETRPERKFNKRPQIPQPAATAAHVEVDTSGGFFKLAGVNPNTAKSLAKAGISAPFPIQSAVIPGAVHGRDMLVQSPTGSGKTLAFGIPIIEQIKADTSYPSALVLCPTRELAIQVSEDLTAIARGKNLSVVAVFGGAPIVAQARRAAKAAIIVATPGRIADLMRSRTVDLRGIKIFVLDEADRMLDMGFQPQVDEIVAKIPVRRQTLLFSATLEGPVAKIAAEYTQNPEIVRNATAVGAGNKIEHILLATTTSTKVDTVLDALSDTARDLAVVFVRTQRGADRLNQRLREYGLRSTAIHGGMNQGQRQREYKRFQAGVCDVLVATDVFARGMDLDRITHVINYDLPEDADTYQHRTGRTGRAGRTGTAMTMVLPNQKRAVANMVRDVGLPADLTSRIIKASGKKWHQVPEAERFSDRPMNIRKEGRNGGGGGNRRGQRGPDNRTLSGAGESVGNGEIATYNDEKGFGFITPDNGGADIFFHRSAVIAESGFNPSRGASVSYEIDPTADRERAALVQLVKGSSDNRRPRGDDKRTRRSHGKSNDRYAGRR